MFTQTDSTQDYLSRYLSLTTLLKDHLNVLFQESNYISSRNTPRPRFRPQRRTTKKPVVISYEEAIKARARPQQQRTTSSAPPTSYDRGVSTEPVLAAESRYNYGYQGAVNPVFVSQSERENVAMQARIPTPPPRNYFPVSGDDYQEDYYQDNINNDLAITTWSDYPTSTEENIYSNNNYFDQKYFDTTKYWETSTSPSSYSPVTSSSSYYNDDIWDGYSKVVQDLLRDKNYGFSGNKYVGQPQSVSTRPLIVSPGMESAGDRSRFSGQFSDSDSVMTMLQPNLISSYRSASSSCIPF